MKKNEQVEIKSIFMTADEVAHECQISKTSAYRIIKELNEELRRRGKYTIRGKINRRFFEDMYINI